MSFQYDQYLANHRANVKRGFDWLCENLSDVTNDISDAAWQRILCMGRSLSGHEGDRI